MAKLPRKLKKLYKQFSVNPLRKFTKKQRTLLNRFLLKEDMRVVSQLINNLLNTPVEERIFK